MPFGSIIGITEQAHHAEYNLGLTPEILVINGDGITFTPVPNMVMPVGFKFSESGGILTYDNGGPKFFLVNGTSDLEVNKATDLTYALVVNGTPVPAEQTTVSFSASGKKRNISITSIAQIATGDTIAIHVRGDGTTGVTATVNKLDVTLLEIQ